MEVPEYFRTAMWIITIATAMVSFGLGVVLNYHWSHFSYNAGTSRLSMGIYCLLALLLTIGMLAVIPA